MKLKVILITLLAFSLRSYSQSKNEVSIVYGTVISNDVITYGTIGDFGFTGKGGWQLGVNYTRNFTRHFSLQTGITVSSDNIQLTTIGPNSTGPQNGNIKVLTVPVLAKLSFWKYLFVDGGLLADFETNYSASSVNAANHTATKQTGIGFELGAGGSYSFNSFKLFVNPFLQNHALVRFGSNKTYTLLNAGFKFGAGYSF